MTEFDPAPTHRNFYGRRHGKTLRQSQKGYLSEDLGSLRPRGITVEENPDRSPIDPAAIFGDARPVWLEVGFGGGEHMVAMAARYPGIGIIGCEPFINGVAMLLGKIRAAGVSNVSVHPGDARDLMDVLPDGSIAKAFLNYPDPWPKARHAKRRMVNDGPLDLIAAKLKPGAEFRLGTDDPTYCAHAMMVMNRRRDFQWTAATPGDFLNRPDDWPETRYERKARAKGHEVWYFRYVRI